MNVKLLVAGAGLLSAALAFGDDLIVNAPTTLSSTADYHNAEIHANLTVDSAASVAVTGDVVTVGSEVGESPVISISGKASLLTQYLKAGGQGGNSSHWFWPATEIGANGGTARFVVSDSAGLTHTSVKDQPTNYRPTTGLGLWLGGVRVSANAAVNNAEDDTIDLLELNKDGYADIACLTNDNAKTVRILFNGGKLRMHYAGTRGSIVNYCPSGKTVEYKSVDGNDIYLYKNYYAPRLIYGGGTLKTSGDGDVVIYEEGYTEGSNKSQQRIYRDADGQIEWGHKGDFRLVWGGVLQPRADDVLPYGPNTGIVHVEGTNEIIYPEIDLYGTSQKMNGLITTGAAYVSNRVSTAASVVLGSGDYEGAVLNARIFGNVTVVKEGSEELSVKSTVAPALSVTSGTVTFVEGDSDFGAVTVAPGAKLVIDGVTLTCQSLVAADEDISCVNGGKFVLQIGSDGAEVHDWTVTGFAGVVMTKSGSNTEVFHPKAPIRGGLHVAEGALVFSGRGYVTNEWRRIWLKQPHGTGTGASLELGEWSVWQSQMPEGLLPKSYYNYRASGNATFSEQGKEAVNLDYSEVTIGDGWKWKVASNEGDPSVLFDSNPVHYLLCITNGPDNWRGIDLTDRKNWVPITLRIKQNQSVGSYSLSGSQYHPYACVKSWLLESSPDGVNWQVMDEREQQTVSTSDELAADNGFFNHQIEYRFQNVTMEKAVGLAENASIRVDKGATLDMSRVVEDPVVAELTIDVANGGGTINKIVPAATGVLNLVNATAEDTKGLFSVPMTLLNAKSLENFAGWTVTVNGKAKPNWGVSYADGAFHFSKPGMTVIVR